jgi:hypothetical protein
MPELTAPAFCTEFAFTAHVSVAAPIVVGEGPAGLRRFVAITGGTVAGPLLNGSVLAAGGDSQLVRYDGVLVVEARYLIRSDDGVLVAVINRGLRDGPPAVMSRLARGEKLAASEYYFRTAAQFEAPMGSVYEGLNKALFVATAEREPDAVIVHFFRVL